jgi:FkbM family methyltransferase
MVAAQQDERAALVGRLREEIGSFRWTSRTLGDALGELTIPGHRPISHPVLKPPGLWERLTRPALTPDGIYEPATSYVLSRLVAETKPARAFDIGATDGYFSLLMASHATVPTAVDAFEIRPGSEAAYAKARSWNPALADRSIDIHAVGISDVSTGTKEVWFHKTRLFEQEPRPEEYRQGPLLRLKHRLSGEAWKTRLTRGTLTIQSIDDFCAAHAREPDLVKMDIDGYEAKALPGGMRLFERRRPWIVLEIHREKYLAPFGVTRADVLGPLLAIGYRAMLIVGRGGLSGLRWIPITSADEPALETGTTDLLILY